jgi:hypothetical protein
MGATIETVRAAKPRAVRAFKKSGALVGVGITRQGSGYALKVNLSRPLKANEMSTTEIDGVPVQIAVVGTIRKQPA